MIVPWNIVELELEFHGDGEDRSRQGIRPRVTTFLASAAARTLSLGRIMRMTDDEARDTFKRFDGPQTMVSPSARIAVS